jgi:hypothetical protein
MRLTDRVASLHPLIVTTATVAWFIGGGVAMNTSVLGGSNWVWIYTATMAVFAPLVLLWHYSIYRAASDRSDDFIGHKGRRGFWFALCALGLGSFLASFPVFTAIAPGEAYYQALATANSLAMVIGCIAYFIAVWAAANALTRFDERKGKVELHKTLGTFLLEIYFPIGVWFIHPRIKRAVAAPLSA